MHMHIAHRLGSEARMRMRMAHADAHGHGARTCRSGCECFSEVRKNPPNSHATLVRAPFRQSIHLSSVIGLGRLVPKSRISSVTETAFFEP